MPFASPFGSFGRPILAFFCAKIPRLLQDCGPYRVLGRFNRMEMQHRYVAYWFLRIVSLMRPCVNPVCGGVSRQLEYLYNSLPNRLPIKSLFYWHALNVLRFDPMKPSNNIL